MEYRDDIDDAEDTYRESSDEDFNPESAPAQDVSSSDEDIPDDATAKPAQRGRKPKPKTKTKRKANQNEDEELDSGDEVTIQAARKTRANKKQKASSDDSHDDWILSDDNDGDGGLIKTRSQRKAEKKERKPLARTEGATVDVDALWAQMMAIPLQPVHTLAAREQEATATVAAPLPVEEEEQIAIKKVYTFAGQDTTEEKQIPRSHLDKYLKDGWKLPDDPEKPAEVVEKTSDAEKPVESLIRRPLRRPTRFDPNPTGFVRALAPEYQLSWPRKNMAILPLQQENVPLPPTKAKPEKAQKLNVVDKSRMDWTGFVDKEGIAEELDMHGKTKEAYLGRMDFLAGVEARREEERRNVKIKASNTAQT